MLTEYAISPFLGFDNCVTVVTVKIVLEGLVSKSKSLLSSSLIKIDPHSFTSLYNYVTSSLDKLFK